MSISKAMFFINEFIVFVSLIGNVSGDIFFCRKKIKECPNCRKAMDGNVYINI